jgi:hypothetical protein
MKVLRKFWLGISAKRLRQLGTAHLSVHMQRTVNHGCTFRDLTQTITGLSRLFSGDERQPDASQTCSPE